MGVGLGGWRSSRIIVDYFIDIDVSRLLIDAYGRRRLDVLILIVCYRRGIGN